uniref:Uncharacterized protein n=1 Tax=Plectus sambesii TaxID=2011161 RepID=A0A914UKL4_9BILA
MRSSARSCLEPSRHSLRARWEESLEGRSSMLSLDPRLRWAAHRGPAVAVCVSSTGGTKTFVATQGGDGHSAVDHSMIDRRRPAGLLSPSPIRFRAGQPEFPLVICLFSSVTLA